MTNLDVQAEIKASKLPPALPTPAPADIVLRFTFARNSDSAGKRASVFYIMQTFSPQVFVAKKHKWYYKIIFFLRNLACRAAILYYFVTLLQQSNTPVCFHPVPHRLGVSTMLMQKQQKKRKGSVLVEYALLIAGVVLVAVVGIAVLGHKMSDQFALMAVILPGAHQEDNVPIDSASLIPFTVGADGGAVLNTALLSTATTGTDRTARLIGANGGETLILDP